MSRLGTYGAINAKLRTRLSKSLNDTQLGALIGAETIPDVLAVLRNTPYSEAALRFEEGGDLRRVEQFLFEKEIDLFRAVGRELPGAPGDFTRALLVRYEVETLKGVLRTWYSVHVKGRGRREDGRFLYRGYAALRVDELLQAQDIQEIVTLLSATPFGAIVGDAVAGLDHRFSLFRLEIKLDNHYYSELDAATQSLDAPDRTLAKRLLHVEIDLENLERIVRLKDLYGIDEKELPDFLIPSGLGDRAGQLAAGGTSTEIVRNYISSNYAAFSPLLATLDSKRHSNLILLESLLGDVLLGEIRRALRGYPFTLGVVLAYFFLVRRETRWVMSVLNAKFYGLDEERLRSLL